MLQVMTVKSLNLKRRTMKTIRKMITKTIKTKNRMLKKGQVQTLIRRKKVSLRSKKANKKKKKKKRKKIRKKLQPNQTK